MGNQRFSIVPAAAVADEKLTDSLFRTLAALGLYGDQNGWCWPSQSTLAEIRGVTRVTINNHIKQLVKFGYLNIHARYDDETGAQKSNAMQIRFDHEYLPPCKAQTLHPLSSQELYTPHKAQDFTHNAPRNDPENDNEALPELVIYFHAGSQWRKPSNGEYKRSQWMDPMVAIYQASNGNFDETKERIKQSIAILKGKNYTVANPGSIQNTAVSLSFSTNGHTQSKTDIAKLFVDAASKYGRQPLKARESLGEHWPLIQHVKGGWSHLSKQSPDNIKFAIFSALKETS
jgi:hypothetical protein